MTTLDRESIDAIIDGVTRRVVAELEHRGTVHADDSRYPRQMSTAAVAQRLGVRPQTVRSNWRLWRLRLLGRGAHGVMIFDGATVARRVAAINKEEEDFT